MLKIQTLIHHRWNDSRLKWDENKYAGIKMFHITSDDLWIPRLFINDSHHHYGLGTCHPTDCIIKSNGEVCKENFKIFDKKIIILIGKLLPSMPSNCSL